MFIIKELDNTHGREIIDLILYIQQVEFNVPVTLEGQPDLLDIESFYIQPGGKFWGAYAGDILIGTIALIHTGHRTGVIRKMFVHKDHRGAQHGVAQALLTTLINYCRQQDIGSIYLGTIDTLKAAQRFYEKNGFVKITPAELPSFFPRMMADNTFYYLSL
ncbi:GNAT family N-acetyltransferase [Niabella beijingensis]|uniref:GNAT family N-acetyltransferase n=1 Tax=Niabella beijingensis TaxID=2872700 RepID=UPI001CBED6A8|nr:GNAT family N-acetyltransferase [Niabella beijingensis]MBZ4187800.1 GNAT family N-acetyltransferase [Niabella beijingensis]